jgi:p-cumate 2,3-dioxygenase ferredoxin reductase subunit
LEVAGRAIERGYSVTIVEAMSEVLIQVGSKIVNIYFRRLHRSRGVEIHTGVAAARSIPGELELSDGSYCPANIVLIGMGVEPMLDLAAVPNLSSPEGNRVDQRGATEVKGIFAAGDVALRWCRCADRWMPIEDWANEQNQAVPGEGESYDAAPWFWSNQYKINLEVAGRFAGAEEIIRGGVAGGRFSVIGLRDGDVIGQRQ